MDSDEECVDVGHAFLDLKELLLTGNDVIEQQFDSRCCNCMIFFLCKTNKILYFSVSNKMHTIALTD